MAVNSQIFETMYDYMCIPEWDEANTLKWLNTIIDNKLYNQRNTDPVDYERLIFTELNFDNLEIQEKVSYIKQQLCDYYKKKKQLLTSCSPL